MMIDRTNITAKQVMQALLGLLILIGFVWLAFYALVLFLIIGACFSLFYFARRALINAGWLTPKEPPAYPPHEPSGDAPIIETDYKDVTGDDNDQGAPR